MEDFLAQVQGLPVWIQCVIIGVFICKLITIITPTQVDDVWFGKLTPFINMLLKGLNIGGLNILKDKNADKLKQEIKEAKAAAPKRATVSDILDGM